MYREAFLIPFFLKHYWFADRIVVLLGDSDDNSYGLLRADKRVLIVKFNMPQGLDDSMKIGGMNQIVRGLSASGLFDWVLMADTDEFVFPAGDPGCLTFKERLKAVEPGANVVKVSLRNVYRHVTEGDLDVNLPGPAVLQRRHGMVKMAWLGYDKPSLARLHPTPVFRPGHHEVRPCVFSKRLTMSGSHWQHADVCFAARRCAVDRTQRLSKHNMDTGMGCGNYNVTEQKILDLCKKHERDPQIF